MRFVFHNCTALITGASSGLGAEFARQLAPAASTLLLAARREDVLDAVRIELLGINPSLRVIVCACDITTEQGRARLMEHIDSMEVKPNLLINNAGAGDYGTFADGDVARARAQVELNIMALLALIHRITPLLPRNREAPAGILNVSSLAGTVPMPGLAVYAATKAFVTSFTEALRIELAGEGIIVSAVCPGPTPTNFGKNARREDGPDTNRDGQDLIRMPPDAVVRGALKALAQGRACVHPGVMVTLAAIAFRLMPRFLMRRIMAKRFHRERA